VSDFSPEKRNAAYEEFPTLLENITTKRKRPKSATDLGLSDSEIVHPVCLLGIWSLGKLASAGAGQFRVNEHPGWATTVLDLDSKIICARRNSSCERSWVGVIGTVEAPTSAACRE
jgi:hypothetical protein